MSVLIAAKLVLEHHRSFIPSHLLKSTQGSCWGPRPSGSSCRCPNHSMYMCTLTPMCTWAHLMVRFITQFVRHPFPSSWSSCTLDCNSPSKEFGLRSTYLHTTTVTKNTCHATMHTCDLIRQTYGCGLNGDKTHSRYRPQIWSFCGIAQLSGMWNGGNVTN